MQYVFCNLYLILVFGIWTCIVSCNLILHAGVLDLDYLISVSGLVLEFVESVVLFVESTRLQTCDCRICKTVNYGCDCDFSVYRICCFVL
jgi:hypothetical protein